MPPESSIATSPPQQRYLTNNKHKHICCNAQFAENAPNLHLESNIRPHKKPNDYYNVELIEYI